MVSTTLLVATMSGALLSALLSGCGSSGDDPTSSSSTSPSTTTLSTSSTTTTTTTTTLPKCEAAGTTGNHLVDSLNKLYLDFNKSTDKSSNGVYIRMHDNFHMHCGAPCYGTGQSECGLGAALYNHQLMTTNGTEGKKNLALALGHISGIVFDAEFVESKIGKCYYQYPAGTDSRKNRGCGHISWHTNCTHPDSPWAEQVCNWKDQTRDTWVNGTCRNLTAQDEDTVEMLCETFDKSIWPMPVATNDTQCAWKGPAFDFNKDTKNTRKPTDDNQVRKMLLQRLENQKQTTKHEPEDKVAHWNEVILDVPALLDWISHVGINKVVPAIVYEKGNPTGHEFATAMSAAAQKQYGGHPIPLLSLDTGVDVRCNGPFGSSETDTMIV